MLVVKIQQPLNATFHCPAPTTVDQQFNTSSSSSFHDRMRLKKDQRPIVGYSGHVPSLRNSDVPPGKSFTWLDTRRDKIMNDRAANENALRSQRLC
eukprot:2858839-Rhodomonas_salina.1